MWIAKNAITGKEYGKPFVCIWDCQDFINTKLKVLEYEMQKAFSLEEQIEFEISDKPKGIIETISDAIRELGEQIKEETTPLFEIAFDKSKTKKQRQKEIDQKVEELANIKWQKNNIIRCYNTDQKRFATGFDF